MASKSSSDPAKVNVRDTSSDDKPLHRTFPGPRKAEAKLRVAMERSAYAELIAHAKSSLDAEVCGVLAGHLCEDDEGPFVSVEAVILGQAASEGGTHVTFTQDTWNAIHKSLERDHPKLKIAGWYHTHPGFGVEFSEMDLFIQRNFFPSSWHLALVTDPLSGAVAICINTPEGIQYLDRFWVDGREQQCRIPARMSAQAGEAPAAGGNTESDRMRVVEERVSQLVQALDETRRFHHRFMFFCGFVFCVAVLVVATYCIYNQWGSRLEPPRVNQVVPVPIQIGDKTVILGVGITSWEVPPELNAILLRAEMLEREAAARQTNAATTNAPGNSANAPGTGPTNAP